jgi:hypothetical protein
MKAKKPLLLAVLIVALLAVALILPGVATGKSDSQPMNWVKGNYNTNNTGLPEVLGGFTINVAQLAGGTLTGQVVQKVILTDKEWLQSAPTVRVASVFYDPVWADFYAGWPFFMDDEYLDNYADFHAAGDSYVWPADLPVPKRVDDYHEGNIANFVAYLPAYFLGLPYPMPHRYVVIDFAEAGEDDLVQIYGWSPVDPYDPFGEYSWQPQLVSTNPLIYEDGNYLEGDPIPVPATDFNVYVGETD